MRKLLLAMFVIAGCQGGVRGQEIRAVDLNQPLKDARVGMAWSLQGDKLGVGYVPVIYWVGESTQLEYVTLNLGASDKLNNGKVGYLVSLGARIDTLFTKLGDTAFAKKHIRFAVLPSLQISPTLITSDFRKFVPYLTIAKQF